MTSRYPRLATSNAIKPAISPVKLVKQAHNLIRDKVARGACVVDATVGNGHDTLFLAEWVGENGKVFGFDIQAAALASASELLRESLFGGNVTLLHCSHADLSARIPAIYHGKVSAVMFNLGYWPGGDKQVITQTKSTVAALGQALDLLAPSGLMTVLAYPGHAGGDQELRKVAEWCDNLGQAHYQVVIHNSLSDKLTAPKLFVINKSGGENPTP